MAVTRAIANRGPVRQSRELDLKDARNSKRT